MKLQFGVKARRGTAERAVTKVPRGHPGGVKALMREAVNETLYANRGKAKKHPQRRGVIDQG